MDVIQVVPVSVVRNPVFAQGFLRSLSYLPQCWRGKGAAQAVFRVGCPGCFQNGSFKQASSGLYGGLTHDGFRGGRMQLRSRAQLSNLSMKMRVRPGFTS